ncbi:MAG: hypothetical protein LAP87_14680 [Acidobacteriia bacterium]|nr:hypothetical protein [Terriglobia bacterium]
MEEIRIRPADILDLPHILQHRRAMFAEMGCQDRTLLDRMLGTSQAALREALPNGAYR